MQALAILLFSTVNNGSYICTQSTQSNSQSDFEKDISSASETACPGILGRHFKNSSISANLLDPRLNALKCKGNKTNCEVKYIKVNLKCMGKVPFLYQNWWHDDSFLATLYVCFSAYMCIRVSFCVCLCLGVCMSLSVCVSLCMFVLLCTSLSLCMSLCLCLCLPLCHTQSLSLSHTVSLSVTHSLSLCPHLSIYQPLSL